MPAVRDGEVWWWADFDGALYTVSERELSSSLADTVLPPFVLVWREGWADWLPAYLVEQFQSALGSHELILPATPDTEGVHTSPPPPPLEWYVECLGEDAGRTTLAREPDSRPSLLDLDWTEFDAGPQSFSPFEAPTRPIQRRSLPAAAFRDAEAYLSQFSAALRRSRSG